MKLSAKLAVAFIVVFFGVAMVGFGTAAATDVTGVKAGTTYSYSLSISSGSESTSTSSTSIGISVHIDNVTDSGSSDASIGYTLTGTSLYAGFGSGSDTTIVYASQTTVSDSFDYFINKNVVTKTYNSNTNLEGVVIWMNATWDKDGAVTQWSYYFASSGTWTLITLGTGGAGLAGLPGYPVFALIALAGVTALLLGRKTLRALSAN